MELKDSEKLIKPVPSRPCSNFRSFSELLTGAIHSSPSTSFTDTTIAIKPKTVRLRPSIIHSEPENFPTLDLDVAVQTIEMESLRTSKSDSPPTVIYKPTPTLASRSTAMLLANMGQEKPTGIPALIPVSNLAAEGFLAQPAMNIYQNVPIGLDNTEVFEPSDSVPQSMEQDRKVQQLSSSSYDGYNWRKYGQKQVKGSEYPRSYYKCTHPSCPMKKKVEKSLDGRITEIVYKGEHNHSKPQPAKRLASVSHGQNSGLEGSVNATNLVTNMHWNNPLMETNEVSFGNQYDVGFSGNSQGYLSAMTFAYDPFGVDAYKSDISRALSRESDVGSSAIVVENERPNSKRRRKDSEQGGQPAAIQDVSDAASLLQASNESDVSGDGFRWRKYGQKVVKGSSYPRSYYRCTNLKCNVRKYVERASDDPTSFITTYEGKHNHGVVPSSRAHNQSQVASQHNLQPHNR